MWYNIILLLKFTINCMQIMFRFYMYIIQASLVIYDLTLCVFAITQFKGKAVIKLYGNFAVTMYGGGVTVERAPAGHILPV
jgi:hypothetical protein